MDNGDVTSLDLYQPGSPPEEKKDHEIDVTHLGVQLRRAGITIDVTHLGVQLRRAGITIDVTHLGVQLRRAGITIDVTHLGVQLRRAGITIDVTHLGVQLRRAGITIDVTHLGVQLRRRSESPVFGHEGFHVDTALKGIKVMMEVEDSPRPNKISAPYEVPQFPIEQIEDKLKLHRQLSAIAVERTSKYEPSETAVDEEDAKVFELDEADYTPHYQRVFISGEETASDNPETKRKYLLDNLITSVPVEDISKSCKLLIEALRLREKYMAWAIQSFPSVTARFLREAGTEDPMGYGQRYVGSCSDPKSLEVVQEVVGSSGEGADNNCSDHPIHPPRKEVSPWKTDVPENCGYNIRMLDGVFQVYTSEEALQQNEHLPYSYPNLSRYIQDMNLLCALIANGPVKSFCYRRLQYLTSKFQLHVLLNEMRELAAQKAVPHRDFYNIRKVSI
ncbi:AMP deaminase 2-like [Panulirus ornatus]|uniref:AMP deaminase 2-like n=1 Tax=Panulirus ornatus TaxID=150431 RepID=UPI003A864E5D